MEAPLGERELDVMAVLWRLGPGTVAEVRERLPASLAYNTVLTILRNLEAKGFVEHTAEGRTFRYHPAVTEAAVQVGALSRLVRKLFRGSAVHVVTQLVEEEALSSDDLRDLQRLVDERLSTMKDSPSADSKNAKPHAAKPKPRRRT